MQRQTHKSTVASREEGGGGEERERTRAAGNARRLEGGTCGRETLARWKYKESKKKQQRLRKLRPQRLSALVSGLSAGHPFDNFCDNR